MFLGLFAGMGRGHRVALMLMTVQSQFSQGLVSYKFT